MTRFDRVADQAAVGELLRAGCAHIERLVENGVTD